MGRKRKWRQYKVVGFYTDKKDRIRPITKGVGLISQRQQSYGYVPQSSGIRGRGGSSGIRGRGGTSTKAKVKTPIVQRRISYISDRQPYKKWELTKEDGKFYYSYFERNKVDLEKWDLKSRKEVSPKFFREKYNDFIEMSKFGMGHMKKE